MKRLILLLTTTATVLTASAQFKYEATATQAIGMHRNVFKSPNTLQTADGLQGPAELYSTGVFSYTALEGSMYRKYNVKNDLRITANGNRQQFINLAGGSVHDAHLAFRYRYHVNRKLTGLMKGGLGNSNHLGINAFASEGVLRFNYFEMWARPEVAYKVSDKNTSRAYIKVARRWYQKLPSGTDMSHRSMEIGLISTQKITAKESLAIKLSRSSRNYFKWSEFSATANNTTENQIDPETGASVQVEERNRVASPVVFGFNTVRVTWKHRASKTAFVRAFGQFQMRNDKSTGTWTYRDFKLGVAGEARGKNFGIAGTVSVARRLYPNRTAHMADATTPALRYNYFNLTVTPTYYVNNQFEVFAQIQLVNRFANSTLQTLKARRGYQQSLAMAGVRWNFNRNTNKKHPKYARLNKR